ncbi:hypothetical protein DL98DRAFT_600297 [Cadophora sp. DSE1049]|nr:hypothetical protein DL98DRAFT_600297 [Cadophora sp. DSE1049]
MDLNSGDRTTQIDLLGIPKRGSPPASPIPSSLSSPTTVSSRHVTPNKKRLEGPTAQSSTATKHQKTTTATENTTLTGSDHKDLAIVRAAEQGISVLDSLTIRYEFPWKSLRSDYELDLGGFVIIASDRGNERDSFIVKRFSDPDMASKLRMLQRIRHVNFLSVLQRFSFEDSYYAVFDHMSILLAHIVTSPPYLRICELAAILFQILEAGIIKITYQETCRDITSSQPHLADVKAIGYIAMELMQKYYKEDGAIGLEDFSRYPSDSDAVDFLAATTSATSAGELLRHRLLRNDV